jgi:hypothetical protein
MRQRRCKGQVVLLRRKTVRESTNQHRRWERLLDVDPPSPETGSHLNGAGPGVEGEGPRGVAIAATRGDGGGVAAGTAMAADVGSTAITPSSSASRLSRVVVVGHRRRWHSIAGEAQPREGGVVDP